VIILQVLQSTLDIPSSLRQELVAGTFERLAISPFGPVPSILALFLFPIASSVVAMLITLALSAIVFGVDVSWSTVPAAIPVAIVAATALGALALLFAAMVVRFKQAPGTAYVLAAISLVAGFYFPPSLLPWWLEWASNVQPFTPAVDLLRHLLVGQELRYAAWEDVVKLLGFSIALVPIGVGGLSLAVDRGRRQGTLTEY
jgi:ABC-2 type transport system permease protein